MHISLKVLTAVGVVSSIGGGAYAINQLFYSSNEIANKLIKEGYTILTNTPENSVYWKTILNNYKNISQSQTKLKFGTFTGEETTPKPEEKLPRLCQELLKPNTSSDTKNEDNYKKAEKWCVLPVTVKDILKNKRYIALDTGTGDTHKSEWTDKVKGLKSATKKIDGLSLNNNKQEATTQEITDIKKKCTDIGEKKNHDDRYEENLGLFKLWCSNKQS